MHPRLEPYASELQPYVSDMPRCGIICCMKVAMAEVCTSWPRTRMVRLILQSSAWVGKSMDLGGGKIHGSRWAQVDPPTWPSRKEDTSLRGSVAQNWANGPQLWPSKSDHVRCVGWTSSHPLERIQAPLEGAVDRPAQEHRLAPQRLSRRILGDAYGAADLVKGRDRGWVGLARVEFLLCLVVGELGAVGVHDLDLAAHLGVDVAEVVEHTAVGRLRHRLGGLERDAVLGLAPDRARVEELPVESVAAGALSLVLELGTGAPVPGGLEVGRGARVVVLGSDRHANRRTSGS